MSVGLHAGHCQYQRKAVPLGVDGAHTTRFSREEESQLWNTVCRQFTDNSRFWKEGVWEFETRDL